MLNYKALRVIDHTEQKSIFSKPNNALASFAIDDALAISVGQQLSPPTLRLWTHETTAVLGIPDSRLPYIEEAIQYLKHKGYQVTVRNSGGLAVALDPGILNLSLILPSQKELSIDVAYQTMYRFVQQMLEDLTDQIKAYEIIGSFCPGDYDLSIGGVKFAGISQRRVRQGTAIQIYIDVAGESRQRAKDLKEFYRIGQKDVTTSFTYPTIQPDVHGALNKLLSPTLTVTEMKNRTKHTLAFMLQQMIYNPLTTEEQAFFTKRYEQMLKRNAFIQQL